MVFTKKIKRNGKIYAIEVEGYRDKNGKVKHKYKRYLGRIDNEGNLIPTQTDIKVERVFQFGIPFIVRKSLEEVKIRDALPDYKEEISLLVQTVISSPASIAKMLRRIEDIDPSLMGEIELPINRKRIENALDSLEENKEIIEQKLYDSMKNRYGYDKKTLFYDITSIALSGHRSALAKIGYPEFEPQINIGLCIEGKHGFPILHDVFPGNIAHRKTLAQIAERLRLFGRDNAVLIFDAGVAGTEKRLDGVVKQGFNVIARIPLHPKTKKLALDNLTTSFKDLVQFSSTKVYVKEIEKEHEKLLVCRNEKLRIAIKEKRYDEVLVAIQRKKRGLTVKDGIRKYIVKKNGEWMVNYAEVEDAEKCDGVYVLYCSVKNMPKESIVRVYFERNRIEKCFSLMKSELEVDPLRFQLDKRIRARLMLCYLAYLVVTSIETKLKENEMPYTLEKLKEILSNVYKVRVARGNKILERVSSMSEEQRKIMNLFGLLS